MGEKLRVYGSTSIEDLAAEQEALDRMSRKAARRRVLAFLGAVFQVVGWWFIHQGQSSQGAAAVLCGLAAWLVAAGILDTLQGGFWAWAAGGTVGAASVYAYAFFRAPGFQWGADPAFYRAVLENHLPGPFPSPLSYLTAQAFLPLLGKGGPDLPLLSAVTYGIAMGYLAFSLMAASRREVFARLFALLAALAAAATLPAAWFSARAMGLTAALGVLMGLALVQLQEVRERPGRCAFLLAGLMFGLHPLWGLLGLVLLFRHPLDTLRRIPDGSLPFLAGCTPYLWVVFHAGSTLGSWGGEHPFRTLLHGWRDLLLERWMGVSAGWPSPEWWGASLLALTAGLLLAGWKNEGLGGRLLQALLAGSGAYLLAAPPCGLPGTLAAWLPVLAVLWWSTLYREARAGSGFGEKFPRFLAFASVLAALALSALPAERLARYTTQAPQRHVENILAGLGSGAQPVILLDPDPCERDALALVARSMTQRRDLVVIDPSALDDRWYLAELIRLHPEVLLSGASGSKDSLFVDLVLRNLEGWDVEWAVPEAPSLPGLADGSCGFRNVPRVLTQRMVPSNAFYVPADDPSAAYDLGEIMEESAKKGGAATTVLGRYAVGLQAWAVAQSRAGRYPEALRGFERSSALDPGYEAPKQALERLYGEKAMVEAARLQFERTAKTIPPRLQALDVSLAKARPDEKPLLLAQKARATEELVDALRHLSTIYQRAGRGEDSRKALEASLKYQPSKAETQLALARMYLGAGDRNRAETAFRAVLEADPQNKEAQAELWKLLNRP